ncbi:amino acid adenylation domain-containing protein [Kroppenstedtia pulmonis]|uniref:Amino acid adenylation domain-containing protein n=1 Tax=Kroppenstedtia pulmonis TaxID=1380685 RepID=A0A7D4CFT3_9BACL|nr:non-ribosomal peptide synthetase [Kroppenstedtia pulmonis]QKG84494.1 amino acid adenylation domain-containing protein [Kroppenstedtia pulmonis]
MRQASRLSEAKQELLERRLRGEVLQPTIPKKQESSPGVLSYAQERLWFLGQLYPDSVAYHVPFIFSLQGDVQIDLLRQCLDELVNRHESLRTVFTVEAGKPVQVIMPPFSLSCEVRDLSDLSEAEGKNRAMAIAEKEAKRPFDLTKGPLVRVKLFKLNHRHYLLFFNIHHIIFDGWSIGILARELNMIYESLEKKSKGSPLAELPIQYADYAHWQKEWLEQGEMDLQLKYWEEQLKGDLSPLDLPIDGPRPARQTFRGNVEYFTLSRSLVKQLNRLSQNEGTTLFITLLTGFQALLHRYTGQSDFLVGTPVANRMYSELEGMIGFFANSLVIRTDISGDPNFRDLMLRVKRNVLESFANQDVPFERLVEHLQPERDMSYNPLFQVAFAFHNIQMVPDSETGLTMEYWEISNGTAKMDLEVALFEKGEEITGKFEYNSDLFHAETIRRMTRHFLQLLEYAANNPECRIGDMPILTEEEKKQMLTEWNQTKSEYPKEMCFPDLFELKVLENPHHSAIRYQSQTISYNELNERANRLAHYLQEHGVGPETLVGICMERSPEMLVGVLGVMKAGGAYLPLDPSYPAERLVYMTEDAGISLILTQAKLLGELPPLQAELLPLDREESRIARYPAKNPSRSLSHHHLAYVIYTSGSTGRPKGVMIEHRGLCNLIHAQMDFQKITAKSRVFQFASLSFDASVFEIFSTWAAGATLCLVPQADILPGPHMTRLLKSLGVTHATLPPTVLPLLAEKELSELQVLVSAGSSCPAEVARRWSEGRTFINAYGPTESTVCATFQVCDGGDRPPSIGYPIANTQVYILDDYGQPVPQGVTGELYIGGDSLARGYLNRPELTRERFIPNPFHPEQEGRLYRTGDLVRYRREGDLEFIGRRDDQVKIRGFRIELGEIETALRRYDEVEEAAVQVFGNGKDEILVGYVVVRKGVSLTEDKVRRFMETQVPHYMIPNRTIFLSDLPLTSNGKVDRKSLPKPDQIAHDAGNGIPNSPTEISLAKIWKEMLQVDRVGVCDNFFQLGGHSLMASQVLARVQEVFHVDLSISILFEKPTIAELAEEVDKRQSEMQEAKGNQDFPEADDNIDISPIKRISRKRYRRESQ